MQAKFLIVLCAALSIFLLSGTTEASEEAQLVGDETCMECHEEIYEGFWKNIHGIKGDPRTPAAMHGDFVCESCHGPGSVHAEEGESGNILALSAKSPEPPTQKNDVCLSCHSKGKVARWQNSTHDVRALVCANCHNVHGNNPQYMTQRTQTEVCTPCHRQIVPQLMLQSRHPIRDGKIKCSDCHNSHGTIADKLVDAQHVNLKCFECHAKTRGPYLWEHPPVVEDCLSCHVPHGSTHASLLNSRSPYLCQRCHSNVEHPSQLQARNSQQAGQSVYRTLNNQGFYRGCLNCHSSIHGSNHPSGKSLLR